ALATTEVTVVDKTVKGTNFYGTQLVLENNILLTAYFSANGVDSGSMYAIASFTDHYGEEKAERIEGADFYTEVSGHIGVDITSLVVADMRQMVNLVVYNADGSEYGSVDFSIESYIAQTVGTAQAKVSDELAKFATSAYNYFH
ncbi:MAG: hypothetical protein IJP38_06325, partial [Oscillospiraceae bacterium]|nr:hypothetical protein [Oscillospiraceae bacterium]